MNTYDVKQAQSLLRVLRWMIAMADRKGMTHGEKHHWLFVAAQIAEGLSFQIGDTDHNILRHSLDTEIEVSDIPF